MDEQTNTNDSQELAGLTTTLAQATQSLAEAVKNMDAQFASLHAKIDLIVAAVEEDESVELEASARDKLRTHVADLEKANHNLKAQAATARRKTLSPMVSALLAKSGVEGDATVEAPIVEKALAGLSVEQRIAVKAELARAGILM